MKRFLYSLLLGAVAFTTADAAQVSAVRAREIASGVLPGITFDTPRRAPSRKGVPVEVPYYVFNASSGMGGYVVVAGDDRLPAILGYSDQGNLELDNAPEALLRLLEMSEAMIDRLDTATTCGDHVGEVIITPLLADIEWGQTAPFNTLCPSLTNGANGYVGCVATAMAQIMKYYEYPAKGTGTYSYVHGASTLSADFGTTTYDWSNMPAIVPENPTETQIQAYSTLCSQVGIAVEMQYDTNGSGAYTMMVPRALRDNFGYSSALRMHSRNYYNTDEWMSMIKTELQAGRPVYYAASSEDGLGGHAFVCDGLDDKDYVHINWGWFGRSNGYFYINHLNPGELGAGGGSGAYNLDQEIITDFCPPASLDQSEYTLYGATRFAPSYFGTDMTFMTYVENLDTKTFDGELLAVLANTDGEYVATLKSESLTLPGFKAGKAGAVMVTMRDIPTATTAPDGEYRLNFGYLAADMDTPRVLRHPIGLPRYATCTVKNGMIMFDAVEGVKPHVEVSNLRPDGDLYVNGSARFLAHLTNRSENFRLSQIELTLTSVDDPAIAFTATQSVNIYDLSAADVEIPFNLPESITEGDYRVTMCHSKQYDAPFQVDETIVHVGPELTLPVIRLTSTPLWNNATTGEYTSQCERDDRVVFSLPARNYAAAGATTVVARISPVDNPSNSSVLSGVTRTWERGEVSTLGLSATVRVEPGEYLVNFVQLAADGSESAVTGLDEPIKLTVNESQSTALEVIDFSFPETLTRGTSSACSLSVKALADFSGTLYIRIRQFTYTSGEIVFMKSGVRLNQGETATYTFNYRPGSSLTDGMYLTMVECGSSSNLRTCAGRSIYYRELPLGDQPGAGIDEISADNDYSGYPVEWYDMTGRRVDNPVPGQLYIRRQGHNVVKIYCR